MKADGFQRTGRTLLTLLALVAVGGGAGCSKKTEGTFSPNLAPTVRLTHAPLSSQSREKYSYRMNWVGYDPDGRVDYFLYKIDPVDPDVPDSTWTATTHNEEVIDFDAGNPDEPVNHNATSPAVASAPHTFAIAAVDNNGLRSPTVYRAFFSTTVAPYIVVESPRPSSSAEALVTPSVRIAYNGSDPDGPTGKPSLYVFRLFGRKNSDFPGIADFINFATNPATKDSMRKLYAPEFGPSDHCPTCTEWQTSPPDSTEAQYTNLIPLQQYLFVATGFDQAGAYDPIFSRQKNMLVLNVSFAGTLGPKITMYNQFFNYTYPTGGYLNDPTRYFKVEVPADQKVTFNWFADAPPGAAMRRYRWVLDLQDLEDETPREGQNDWYHWSSWSLSNTSAIIGPFTPPPGKTETHLFFIEAEDNNGLVSLGIIQFTVVRPTFNNDLLIVQDCRLIGDKIQNGIWQAPTGSWPNKAELDSFFYGRGGYPWKGAYEYPSNGGPYTSRPGIFNGYQFDTLSVRGISTGIVPLAILGKYKYVVWYVDNASATLTGSPNLPATGAVSLRFMSGEPGRGAPNTLATFMQQGGSAWVFGGGVATATLAAWNRTGTSATEFTFRDNELIPGRFMYDYPHWRSKVEIGRTIGAALLNWQYPKFNSESPSRGWVGAPDYSKLVATALWLTGRQQGNPVDDPPPLRRPDSFWYSRQFAADLVTDPNFIIEDINGEAPGGEESTLDTIYTSQESQAAYVDRPIMTYYHGIEFKKVDFDSSVIDTFPATRDTLVFDPAKFVYAGFPLWYFSRPQQIALVDFVLQDIWGLTRDDVPREATPQRSVAASTAAPPTTGVRRIGTQAARPLTPPGARPLAPQIARPLRSPGVQR